MRIGQKLQRFGEKETIGQKNSYSEHNTLLLQYARFTKCLPLLELLQSPISKFIIETTNSIFLVDFILGYNVLDRLSITRPSINKL